MFNSGTEDNPVYNCVNLNSSNLMPTPRFNRNSLILNTIIDLFTKVLMNFLVLSNKRHFLSDHFSLTTTWFKEQIQLENDEYN